MKRSKSSKPRKPRVNKSSKSKSSAAAITPGKCGCGCGEPVTRRFKQGHDSRVKPGSKWREAHPEYFTRAAVAALIQSRGMSTMPVEA